MFELQARPALVVSGQQCEKHILAIDERVEQFPHAGHDAEACRAASGVRGLAGDFNREMAKIHIRKARERG